MKKIISIIVSLCFLFTNIGFTADTYNITGRRGNANLAAPLALDDIGLDSPVHKRFSIAMLGLQLELKKAFDTTPALNGTRDVELIKEALGKLKKFESGVKTNRVVVTYENAIKQIGNSSIFAIPVSIGQKSDRQQCTILFSSELSEKTKMFPMSPIADEKLKGLENLIAVKEEMPEFKDEKDRQAIDRDMEHQLYDKEVIDWAHKKRGLAIEVDLTWFIDEIEDIAQIKIDAPRGLKSFRARKFYLIPRNSEVEERLNRYKVTVVDIEGNKRKVVAYEHSSNEATHLFVSKVALPIIIKMAKEKITKEHRLTAAEMIDTGTFRDGLLPHAAGVVTGCPVIGWTKDGQPLNEIDKRYREGLADIVLSEIKTFTAVDLDNLRGINSRGEEYERDYAMGEMHGIAASKRKISERIVELQKEKGTKIRERDQYTRDSWPLERGTAYYDYRDMKDREIANINTEIKNLQSQLNQLIEDEVMIVIALSDILTRQDEFDAISIYVHYNDVIQNYPSLGLEAPPKANVTGALESVVERLVGKKLCVFTRKFDYGWRNLYSLTERGKAVVGEIRAKYGFKPDRPRDERGTPSAAGKSKSVDTVFTPEEIAHVEILNELSGKSLTHKEQFDLVYKILSKYLPGLAKVLAGLKDLINESSPDVIRDRLNRIEGLYLTDTAKSLLRLAFFTPGEGSGRRDYAAGEMHGIAASKRKISEVLWREVIKALVAKIPDLERGAFKGNLWTIPVNIRDLCDISPALRNLGSLDSIIEVLNKLAQEGFVLRQRGSEGPLNSWILRRSSLQALRDIASSDSSNRAKAAGESQESEGAEDSGTRSEAVGAKKPDDLGADEGDLAAIAAAIAEANSVPTETVAEMIRDNSTSMQKVKGYTFLQFFGQPLIVLNPENKIINQRTDVRNGCFKAKTYEGCVYFYVLDNDYKVSVYMIREGNEITPLYTTSSSVFTWPPSFSPSGRYLFIKEGKRYDVTVLDLKAPQEVALRVKKIDTITLSPDEKYVVFETSRLIDLYLMYNLETRKIVTRSRKKPIFTEDGKFVLVKKALREPVIYRLDGDELIVAAQGKEIALPRSTQQETTQQPRGERGKSPADAYEVICSKEGKELRIQQFSVRDYLNVYRSYIKNHPERGFKEPAENEKSAMQTARRDLIGLVEEGKINVFKPGNLSFYLDQKQEKEAARVAGQAAARKSTEKPITERGLLRKLRINEKNLQQIIDGNLGHRAVIATEVEGYYADPVSTLTIADGAGRVVLQKQYYASDCEFSENGRYAAVHYLSASSDEIEDSSLYESVAVYDLKARTAKIVVPKSEISGMGVHYGFIEQGARTLFWVVTHGQRKTFDLDARKEVTDEISPAQPHGRSPEFDGDDAAEAAKQHEAWVRTEEPRKEISVTYEKLEVRIKLELVAERLELSKLWYIGRLNDLIENLPKTGTWDIETFTKAITADREYILFDGVANAPFITELHLRIRFTKDQAGFKFVVYPAGRKYYELATGTIQSATQPHGKSREFDSDDAAEAAKPASAQSAQERLAIWATGSDVMERRFQSVRYVIDGLLEKGKYSEVVDLIVKAYAIQEELYRENEISAIHCAVRNSENGIAFLRSQPFLSMPEEARSDFRKRYEDLLRSVYNGILNYYLKEEALKRKLTSESIFEIVYEQLRGKSHDGLGFELNKLRGLSSEKAIEVIKALGLSQIETETLTLAFSSPEALTAALRASVGRSDLAQAHGRSPEFEGREEIAELNLPESFPGELKLAAGIIFADQEVQELQPQVDIKENGVSFICYKPGTISEYYRFDLAYELLPGGRAIGLQFAAYRDRVDSVIFRGTYAPNTSFVTYVRNVLGMIKAESDWKDWVKASQASAKKEKSHGRSPKFGGRNYAAGEITKETESTVVVVGSIVADIIVPIGKKSPYELPKDDRLAGRVDKRSATPPAEAVMGYLDSLEPSLRENLTVTFGGPAFASAMVLNQLGVKVKLVGAVGSDEIGKRLISYMQDRGMDIRGIKVIEGVSTSSNLIFSNQDTGGTAYNLMRGGANDFFSIDLITDEDLHEASVLHFGGPELCLGLMRNRNIDRLIEQVHASNVKVGWDIVVDIHDIYGRDESRESALAAMRMLDYITLSMGEQEAPRLLGKERPEDILHYFGVELGIPAVFLKRGENGSEILTTSNSVFGMDIRTHMPAPTLAKLEDETGAGDSYSAFIAKAVRDGLSPIEAAKGASVCGALTCERRGGASIGDEPVTMFNEKMKLFNKETAELLIAERAQPRGKSPEFGAGSQSQVMIDSISDFSDYFKGLLTTMAEEAFTPLSSHIFAGIVLEMKRINMRWGRIISGDNEAARYDGNNLTFNQEMLKGFLSALEEAESIQERKMLARDFLLKMTRLAVHETAGVMTAISDEDDIDGEATEFIAEICAYHLLRRRFEGFGWYNERIAARLNKAIGRSTPHLYWLRGVYGYLKDKRADYLRRAIEGITDKSLDEAAFLRRILERRFGQIERFRDKEIDYKRVEILTEAIGLTTVSFDKKSASPGLVRELELAVSAIAEGNAALSASPKAPLSDTPARPANAGRTGRPEEAQGRSPEFDYDRITKILEEALALLPDKYRNNGMNYESLAQAMQFAWQPKLEATEHKALMNYVEGVFRNMFKGENLELEVIRHEDIEDEEDMREISHHFITSPRDLRSAMFINVYPLDERGGRILRSDVGPDVKMLKQVSICVAFIESPEERGYRSIYIETHMNEPGIFEMGGEIPIVTHMSVASKPREVMEDMHQHVAAPLTKKDMLRLPGWAQDVVKTNVIDLSKLDEKAALVFSKKATFDNKLGVLLPRLVKAGIKVGVIAETPEQKELIEELNRQEGITEDREIICEFNFEAIRDKMNEMAVSRYYYFKVKGDEDISYRNVTTFDITNIVKQVIEALGEACGIRERELLDMLHKATEAFGRAL